MADDSMEIVENFDFHPCNSPRGMLYYDLNILTAEQQTQLNDFKRNLIRENEKYLARHPEVRALIALVTRHVLTHRPRSDVHVFVGHFFSRPKPDIEDEMQQYIEAREPHNYEGDSAVIIRGESSEELTEPTISLIEEEVEEDLEAVPRQILDEILEKAFDRLGIDVDDTEHWEPPEFAESEEETSESVVKSIISEILTRAVKDGESEAIAGKEIVTSDAEPPSTKETEATEVSEMTEIATETNLEMMQQIASEKEAGVAEVNVTEIPAEINLEMAQQTAEESKQEYAEPLPHDQETATEVVSEQPHMEEQNMLTEVQPQESIPPHSKEAEQADELKPE